MSCSRNVHAMRRSMTEVVLDASAVLAVLRREHGHDAVSPHLRGGRLSAVNLSEVIVKAADIGIDADTTIATLESLGVLPVDFDHRHATATAALHGPTLRKGISLADRACLALAKLTGLPALTGDRRWLEINTGIEVRVFR